MADWLLIRLPRAPEEHAAWMVADATGRVVQPPQSGPLAHAAALAADRRVALLVPGADVLLTEADLPVKSQAKLQKIVPYALEEQLADDVENLHFAIGRRVSGATRTRVAVVARALMDDWLAAVRNAGITPNAMYADSELLPANPGQIVALLEDDVAIVRPVGAAPVVVPIDLLAEALEAAAPATPEGLPTQGLIVYATQEQWDRHAGTVEAQRLRYESVSTQILTQGPLPLLAQQLSATAAINLLQASYAPKSAFITDLRPWRTAAILFAALVGLHIAGMIAELFLLQRTERTLDAATAETFRQAMPGEQNAVDARRRMEQRLLAVRGGIDSRGLLAALNALATASGTAPGTRVEAMSYREGSLELRLAAPDAESLDRLAQAIRNTGWQADLISGNVVDSGYEGRIQMRPPGGA